jgi:hypothetical protein
MRYTTQHTTRLAGFMLAVIMATAINGSLLWKFDDMAQAGSAQAPATVTLESVTIVGHQS